MNQVFMGLVIYFYNLLYEMYFITKMLYRITRQALIKFKTTQVFLYIMVSKVYKTRVLPVN